MSPRLVPRVSPMSPRPRFDSRFDKPHTGSIGPENFEIVKLRSAVERKDQELFDAAELRNVLEKAAEQAKARIETLEWEEEGWKRSLEKAEQREKKAEDQVHILDTKLKREVQVNKSERLFALQWRMKATGIRKGIGKLPARFVTGVVIQKNAGIIQTGT